VSDDVDGGLYASDDTVGIVELLGQANGVDLAADAADFAALLTAVGVRVRPVDRCIA